MKSFLLALILLCPIVSYAKDFKNVEYVSAYDGDTVKVNIKSVPDVFGKKN